MAEQYSEPRPAAEADGNGQAAPTAVLSSPAVGVDGQVGGGWEAHLRLSFEHRLQRTVLARAAHSGPLRVQRAFYPPKDTACHVYILHPPGGVVSGDSLSVAVTAGEGARALLTAPGATKLYRSRGAAVSSIATRIDVADNACVEWLPHEVIVFDGARSALTTEVELSAGASYMGWEIVCLGRPACGEAFTTGELWTSLRISRAGRPLFCERALYEGGGEVLRAPWGLLSFPCFGTCVLVAPEVDSLWVERLREALADAAEPTSVTLVSGVLVVRCFAQTTRDLRRAFELCFACLRPLYAACDAVMPRIWST